MRSSGGVYSHDFNCHSNNGQLLPVFLSVILSHRHIDLQPDDPGSHGVPEKLPITFALTVDIANIFGGMFSAILEGTL